MTDINKLFFELIRVAIGNAGCLSHSPTAEEWQMLYEMAKKQSLVGICFAGVQKLQAQRQAPNSWGNEQGEMLYLQWMGMAAKIQQRNELLNRKGKELISQFQNAGLDACVLKGQSLAPYYGDLAALRQSGDIDVWVRNKSIEELDAYVKGLGFVPKTTAAHVSYEDKNGVEVELHAVPAFLRNFRTNRKLAQWFKEFNGSTEEFNLVFLMVHMYHHVLFEGLGLRQVMDYYFVLRTQISDKRLMMDDSRFAAPSFARVEFTEQRELPQIDRELSVNAFLKEFGMERFSKGMMWIMQVVFGLEKEYVLCEADEKIGRLLLSEIMDGGNFGKYSENKGVHSDSAFVRGIRHWERNVKFFMLAPWEILCSPLWSLWHWWWRKKRNFY